MIFVDTSAWFAAANGNDANHARAKAALSKQPGLLTSNLVVAETWRLLHQKLQWQAAESFWRIVRKGAAELECVTAEDMEAAWLNGQRYPDQNFSLTDRTSFALMERLQITDVATFDHHFAVYRFGGNKSGAFRLVN